MQYEQQKAACAEYAHQNGGSVADVLRVNGNKGAVVVSKDGRTIFDPFVIEPIKDVFTAEPMKEMEEAVKERVTEEVKAELPAAVPEPRKKPAPRKKK